MGQLRRKFKATSKLVGQLTELLYSVTNSLVIRRGGLTTSTATCLTHRPDRYAYVEFAEPEHVDTAVTLDNSLFRGRLIKVGRARINWADQANGSHQVTAKRTNIPGFNRGRGRGRGGYRGGYRGNPGYSPYSRGRGR